MKSPSALALAVAALLSLSAALPAPQAVAEEDVRPVLALARAVYRETSDAAFQSWLRDTVHDQSDDRRYGLHLDAHWQQAAARSPQRPLVVLIHGFNSTAAQNAAVMAPISAAGFPIATFSYPNDHSLTESSAFLSRQLKNLASDRPHIKVALVTHSMGGLVARACLEDPELDPGIVDRLIMIAPPTHGTLIAHAAIGADLWEHWLARRDGDGWARWRESVVDGLGEAADDLVPQSAFLTRLNARARNPRVNYAIFLGTRSPVSARDMQILRWAARTAGSRVEGLRDYVDSIDALAADMDEVIDGKGDGVVAIKRGRLDGVSDVVLMPFDHLSCTGDPTSEAVQRLQKDVLSRLQ